jgi:hypothetical protein
MKDEFEKNLTEQPEADDLGIRAAMEGIEPEEGARERMLQNIMRKAETLRAAENGEASKAEILSLDAAKKAAGAEQASKAKKKRWKLYVPMLAAAALILTIGTIFFVRLGRDNASGSAERHEQDNVAAGTDKTPDSPHDTSGKTVRPADDKNQSPEKSDDEEPRDGWKDGENISPESHDTASIPMEAPHYSWEAGPTASNGTQAQVSDITNDPSHETDIRKTYKVTILDPAGIITDKPDEEYFAPGTLLEFHSGVICDVDGAMYVNGEFYSLQNDLVTEDGDCIGWEYTFEMIPEDVVIEFRLEGGM